MKEGAVVDIDKAAFDQEFLTGNGLTIERFDNASGNDLKLMEKGTQ